MASKDYYETLGIDKNASKDDIKHAYRHLSKKYHPDLNKEPGAEEKFKEITEAYEVLGDDKKRANYDQYGSADGPQGFGGFGGGAGAGQGGADYGDFSDIFNQFFGGGGRGRSRRPDPTAPQRGRDLQYNLNLTFEEAIFGCKKTIKYNREEQCPTCKGTGAKKGTKPETCSECHGTGSVMKTVNTPLGQVQSQQECPKCHGTGKIIKEKCPTCGGTGLVEKEHELEVTVPAGVESGQQMRLDGQGDAGINGGPYGDLYIFFTVAPSKDFKRDGATIYYDQPISFATAALGKEIQVKTVNGDVKLKIPAGTQTGTTFRLKGQGAPSLHGTGKGDELVTVTVDTPKHMNSKQKVAMQAFAEASGDLDSKGSKTFFDKMKDAFK